MGIPVATLRNVAWWMRTLRAAVVPSSARARTPRAVAVAGEASGWARGGWSAGGASYTVLTLRLERSGNVTAYWLVAHWQPRTADRPRGALSAASCWALVRYPTAAIRSMTCTSRARAWA